MKYDLVVNVDLVFMAVLALICLAAYAIGKAVKWIKEAKSDIVFMCSTPPIEATNLTTIAGHVSETRPSIEKSKFYLAKADLARAEADLIRTQAANLRREPSPCKNDCTGDGSGETSS